MVTHDSRRLLLDDGGRPRTDEGGRLVYINAEDDAVTETEADLADGQGVEVTDPADIDPANVDPENTGDPSTFTAGPDDSKNDD